MASVTFQKPVSTVARVPAVTMMPPVTSRLSPLAQRLSSHVIEAELLHGYPRLVKRTQPVWAWKYTILWALIGLQTYTSFSSLYRHPEYFVLFATCFLAMTVLQLFYISEYTRNAQQRVKDRQTIHLLRYGIATPTFVQDMQEQGDDCRVDFLYQDRFGDIQMRSHSMPLLQSQKHKFQVGGTCTLLISPEDDHHILPYLPDIDFTIQAVAPTVISQQVSANLYTQMANKPLSSAHLLGAIEPELAGETPRPIKMVGQDKILRWTAFGLATAGTVAFFFPAVISYIFRSEPDTINFHILPLVVVSSFSVSLLFARRFAAQYLKHGTSSRQKSFRSPLLKTKL